MKQQNSKPQKRPAAKKSSNTGRKSKPCNRCGFNNVLNARKCAECASTKFAPLWVHAKRPINRQVAVEVTSTNPAYGDVQQRLTLSKWWPGGASTFHIPNLAQWSEIENIINGELAPYLNWKEKDEIIEVVREKQAKGKDTSTDLQQLVSDHPEFLKQVVAAIKPERLTREDTEGLVTVMTQLSEALSGLDAGFRETFVSVVSKLPRQGKRALEELEELLSGWSLHQITYVTQQVKHRLETIELFRKQIEDPRTYEIRGDNSIHRILEKAMWLIDERYWLMHSNRQVRTSIGQALSKKDKKRYGDKRPDFVCGTIGDRLIIIEIKRPAHKLGVEDLNQLEQYSVLAEDYLKYTAFEGYLVGSARNADLMRYVKRRRGVQVLSYSELVDRSEERYREYLKTKN